MAKNVVKNVTMVFEDSQFTDQKGNMVDFVSVTANIAGEDIKMKIAPQDKSLFRMLRRSLPVEKE